MIAFVLSFGVRIGNLLRKKRVFTNEGEFIYTKKMKTWNEYKEHVKNVDPDLSKDIHETKEIAAVVSAMVQQRNKLGLSQRELAQMCGIPQSSVARIEFGKITPNLGTLLKIFRNLGTKARILGHSMTKMKALRFLSIYHKVKTLYFRINMLYLDTLSWYDICRK